MVKKRELIQENPAYSLLFSTKQGKGEKAKAEIVESTINLLATRGFHETNFETIAHTMGVRRSHIAYHFKDLDTLIEATLKLITLTAQSITIAEVRRNPDSWEDQVRGYVSGAFLWLKANPKHFAVLMLFYHLSVMSPKFRALHTQIRRAGRNRVFELLMSSPLGKKHSSTVIEDLAALIQFQMTGAIIDFATTEPDGSLDACHKNTIKTIFRVLETYR